MCTMLAFAKQYLRKLRDYKVDMEIILNVFRYTQTVLHEGDWPALQCGRLSPPPPLDSRLEVYIHKNQCLCQDTNSGLPFRIQRAMVDYVNKVSVCYATK